MWKKTSDLRAWEVVMILHLPVNEAISYYCEQWDQPTSTEFRTNMKSSLFQALEITIIVAYGVYFYPETPEQN